MILYLEWHRWIGSDQVDPAVHRSALWNCAYIPVFHTSSRILPPTEWIFVSLSSPEDIKRLYNAEHALALEWNFDVANFSRVLSTSASMSHSRLSVAMISSAIDCATLLLLRSSNQWWDGELALLLVGYCWLVSSILYRGVTVSGNRLPRKYTPQISFQPADGEV